MEIQTERLLLRPWYWEDADRLQQLANHYEIARQLRDGFPHPYLRGDAEQFLSAIANDNPVQHFAITENGYIRGSLGYVPDKGFNRHSAELGYWIDVGHQGRGLATEAVAALTEYLLTSRRFHRLRAMVLSDNTQSARVLEKCGFVREGVLRDSVIREGRWHHEVLYARLGSWGHEIAARDVAVGAGRRFKDKPGTQG